MHDSWPATTPTSRHDCSECGSRTRTRRALVERLYPQVIRIVRSHPPVRAAEKDLAQEIFLKLFTRLNQYRERASVPFQHWVSRLAVRTCLDASRAERRRPEWRWSDLSEEQSAWLEFSKFDRIGVPNPGRKGIAGKRLARRHPLLCPLPSLPGSTGVYRSTGVLPGFYRGSTGVGPR